MIRAWLVFVLVFAIGCVTGAAGTAVVVHDTIKRQVAQQDAVLLQARKARKTTKDCRVALESVWDKIRAGRDEYMRLLTQNGGK